MNVMGSKTHSKENSNSTKTIMYNNNKDAEDKTMNRSRRNLRNLLLPLMAVALLFSVACDYAATTAPDAPKASAQVTAEARPLTDVNFLRWSPATMEKLKHQLNKDGDDDDAGSETEKIKAKKGGTVGGDDTFDNTVYFEPYSFDEKKQRITVRATCMDNDNPCAAEIEFLPSQKFNKDVLITLSYEALGFTGDPYELEIYWLQEDGSGGLITEYTVDEEEGTVSFWIDHFTRYGWAY